MAREDVGLQVSPSGEITAVNNTERQIAAMHPSQGARIRQITEEMGMLAGAMQSLKDDIAYQERKLKESPLAVSLKKNKEKLKRVSDRYLALVHGYNTLFDVATQDAAKTPLSDRYERIFREMDEEDELIAKAERARLGEGVRR
ncbi:MAG: hypothetical protein JNL32_07700 [Candidatus Kapabacteria bacterium]|nr:hypothetical protein [Candidatus Kapabacteria bacterium]